VYEPFSGSGTSIIAAEMTGRICHAIELNPAYVDVAVARWQAVAGETALLEESGESFPEVGAERNGLWRDNLAGTSATIRMVICSRGGVMISAARH
jgi:hypothetical protein